MRSPIPGHTLPFDLAVTNSDNREYNLTLRIERASTTIFDETFLVRPNTSDSNSWYTQNVTFPSEGTYDVFVELDTSATDTMQYEAPTPAQRYLSTSGTAT